MWSGTRALTFVAWSVLIVFGVLAGTAAHQLWKFRGEIERLADELVLDTGPESTLIYDLDDNLVSAVFEEYRIGVQLDQMSPHLVNAVLVIEDRRFFDHGGIDARRILAAAVANYRAGDIVQGGSTITQQLVKLLLLSPEQTYERKVKEAILARRLEERYSKEIILQAYLNRVYFGDGYYGAEAAALGYFGKPVGELTPAEAATLAGLVKGPSVYAPTRNPELAQERRDLILAEMREAEMLGDAEYEEAVAVPVTDLLAQGAARDVPDPRRARGGEYFRDAVRRELVRRFGSEAVHTGGLRVYTTLDTALQHLAEQSISNRLQRMPRAGSEPLQGALVAIDPRTGHVKALVGGRDFAESPYNRAIDARRQPGSAFKPFIFAAALEAGLSPGTMITNLDEPIPSLQGPWLPGGEYEETAMTLGDALVRSSNRAAAHLLQQVGIHRTVNLVQRFGISSPMPAVPSLALGTGEVTVLELTSAFGAFANYGRWNPPTTIRRVTDRHGRELYRAEPTERPVISEATAYVMTSMMADVMNRGTGTSARANGFRRPAAGKTGTSQEYADAWFVGYTPTIVTGVWFGYDTPRPIMNRGFASVVAVPAWARFMTGALRGVRYDWYRRPRSLVEVRICALSGLLATDRCHLPVYDMMPPDGNDDVMVASLAARSGDIVDDVRPAGQTPPPCYLPHTSEPPAAWYTMRDREDELSGHHHEAEELEEPPATDPLMPPASMQLRTPIAPAMPQPPAADPTRPARAGAAPPEAAPGRPPTQTAPAGPSAGAPPAQRPPESGSPIIPGSTIQPRPPSPPASGDALPSRTSPPSCNASPDPNAPIIPGAPPVNQTPRPPPTGT